MEISLLKNKRLVDGTFEELFSVIDLVFTEKIKNIPAINETKIKPAPLSRQQMKEFLNLKSETTFQKMVNMGLPCMRVGRRQLFDPETVMKWLAENKIKFSL